MSTSPTCSPWRVDDIANLEGKTAVVTGATGGLGYETALALVQKGAKVILVGRSESKGKEAVNKIKPIVTNAKVSFERADLVSLASIEEFARRFRSQHESLDILINNAGVMAIPQREITEDGFEMQFGTNHLAHFALTCHLLPALRKGVHPRVVNVSSLAHKQGKINFEDLQSAKSYSSLFCYAQSKLANLLFTLELQKRSDEGNWGLLCASAHPGLAKTHLVSNGRGENSWSAAFYRWFLEPVFYQSAADGALPILYAATAPDVQKTAYYGPNGFWGMKGAPAIANKAAAAENEDVAKKLWEVSTSLTKVKWI